MKIERIVYPVITLGPDKRIGVWTIGCPHNCFGCINPELQVLDSKKNIDVSKLAEILVNESNKNKCRSITFTGGDPMYQKGELLELLKLIRPYFDDILVYTGYEYCDLNKEDLLNIDVLIDGKYIEEFNEKDLPLRGSSNQNVIFINRKLIDKYEMFMEKGRPIQNMIIDNELISIGIHNRLEGK
jgi:anaerobic ribonucleoside-triphosphate reductase activating protein